MKVAMIGTGYVGLVSGACFADFGHRVVCVDKDESKISRLLDGEIPIFEPGLDALVADNVKAGRLSFTTDLAEGMKDADAVFIAVGTPSRRGDGHADLSYVYAATEEIAALIDKYTVVVTKSTVPVGTGAEVEAIIQKVRDGFTPGEHFSVASNPEFLREGAAIDDFKRPDRVVCGVEDDRAKEVLTELYRPLFLNETPILFTQRVTSELIKYAANAFLATKITFINEMADLCEKVGADVQAVARGIGLDKRIGSKFLNAGPGYGGSCFPKDTLALVRTAQQHGAPVRIVESVVEANDTRKKSMAGRVKAAVGGDLEGKTVAVLGLAFKPNTDDMRDSPSLDIIPALIGEGASVQAHDPESMNEARKHFGDTITYCDGPYETLEGADVLVIVTEWDEFRALDLARVKEALSAPVIVDLRNIYRPDDMAEKGWQYHSIGR
ncbi:UDP-glucose/GDP-mannose dehydrogenase family protein [Parvularcula flava]|uniref:UDP-glucose 6-dehydrogenase n=1 Tax=Aquisalinus luteolus TaxID=1566827 RepID=A0A8J3EVT6_9PROT|nr:UDP-glucose/GDP-mannose dehydrogenase family protein [Aquisalinus luteolus]NHK29535.1 UDP-glucose/GDP-mannose dehydrogenase family protein [Aquisalinus luteolus]GGI01646.1 UDP-glucose 6-dehydrogenase [Aquisalinus luteolus]